MEVVNVDLTQFIVPPTKSLVAIEKKRLLNKSYYTTDPGAERLRVITCIHLQKKRNKMLKNSEKYPLQSS